jgi:hypothetical protein
MNVSGRDILHRIRRSKKRALNSRVSIPTPRLGRVLKQVVKKKVEQGIIRTGIDIAPKSFEKNVIGSDGKLPSTQTKVYGEKNTPTRHNNIRNKTSTCRRHKTDIGMI